MSATLGSLRDGVADDEPDDGSVADGEATEGRSRRRLVLIAALVAVLAAAAVYVVAFSPLLGARTVTVRGASGALVQQIRRAAAIRSGTPLLRLDTAGVAARVERIAVVSAAQVSTSYPSTVQITVTRRTPVGVVRAGSGYLLVDGTGMQYARVAAPPKALPLFVIPAGAGARRTGGAAATVAAALSPRLRARMTQIQALDPEAITLQLKDQRVVRWGSARRSEMKARILPTLLRQRGTYLDVTDPDRPFSR